MNIKRKGILTLLVIMLFVAGYAVFFAVLGSDTVDKYIKSNLSTASFTGEGISSALKRVDDGNEYNIFFTGEYHDESRNKEISLEMLKYLNKEYGVNYLVCEVQYSIISKLNEYIQNGDEKLLNDSINLIKERNPEYAGETYYDFWKGLYDYNKNLPKGKKIQAFGIDMDFIPTHTLNEMVNLVSNNEPPTEIASKIKKIKELFGGEVSDEQEATNILTDINEDLNKNTQHYKAFLGDNLQAFKSNLSSMMNTAKYAETMNVNRDPLMYDNFMRIYKENPKGKYYGQFGVAHIFRQDIILSGNEFFTLAKMLEKKGNLKVLSIPVVSSNKMELVSEAEKLVKGNFSVIKLNGKNSPYKKENEDMFVSDLFGTVNGTIVDNYQYVIYYRDK